jgi:hypothetical protein
MIWYFPLLRKRGRPVLLGEELDEKVQTLINELRNKGGNVNSRIVRALGKGVVKAKDRTLLVENGGSIEITPLFLNSLIRVCTFWSSSSRSKTCLPRFLGCNSVISATLSSESVDSNSFLFPRQFSQIL